MIVYVSQVPSGANGAKSAESAESAKSASKTKEPALTCNSF